MELINLKYLSDPPPGAHALSCAATVWGACGVCWLAFLMLLFTEADLPKVSLKRKDRIEWHSRVISSAHAIILCVGEQVMSHL
jgi:hypothetical protein